MLISDETSSQEPARDHVSFSVGLISYTASESRQDARSRCAGFRAGRDSQFHPYVVPMFSESSV